MVRVNWEQILSVRASALTDQEIEDIFPMVVSCDVEDVESIQNLRVLMKLSQEVLQYKDNQVESLLLECDELKQKILNSKPSSNSRKKKSLASDLVNDDGDSISLPGNESSTGKNKKIAILMNELETIEAENMTLKDQLRLVKEEMEDATIHMNQITEELNSFKEKNLLYKEKLKARELESKALMGQIKAMTNQQLDRDKVIDEFSTAIDARVTEWKAILDEKDVEIAALKENLSQSLMQSLTSVREENKSQIVHLNQIINQRDQTIERLQSKLSEAVAEMNETTILIEKLKADAQKIENSNRRKEQRSLLDKIQQSNEKILNLQNDLAQAERDAEVKSKELCDALVMLKKYENSEYGLADAIAEMKGLKDELRQKETHIEDLVNIINKMEMLNSHQEMEIAALCEKFDLPPGQAIPVDDIVAKRAKEMQKVDEMKRENEYLKKKNLELKSDVRTLKYRMKNLSEKMMVPRDKNVDQVDLMISTPIKTSKTEHDWDIEREEIAQRHMAEIEDIRDNVRLVVEENEALRKGMHEILDSVHNQDGKCAVEIQSQTLELLLEALDVRHVAGWYHPAMRLQNRLSAIQGSNSELRAQLKQIRLELQKKDEVLQRIVSNNSYKDDTKQDSMSESGEAKAYDTSSRFTELQRAYDIEKSEWQLERNSLYEEKNELEESITKLEVLLKEYEKNWQILESSNDDEIKTVFAKRCKENAEHMVQIIVLNRKCKILEELLSKESTRYYNSQKEAAAMESELRKRFADLEKANKLLDARNATLQSNLSNSVSSIEYNDLNDKYTEVCIRLKLALEESKFLIAGNKIDKRISVNDEDEKSSEDESSSKEAEMNSEQQSKASSHKELNGRQGANRTEKLYEIAQGQLEKSKIDFAELSKSKTELGEQIIQLQNELSKYARANAGPGEFRTDEKTVEELSEKIKNLIIDNENLARKAEIATEEAQMHATHNFLKTFEMDSLRHQLLDLQSVSEDKEMIARLGFELTNCKKLEAETSKKNNILQSEILHLRNENDELKRYNEDSQGIVRDCQRRCDTRCGNYLELIHFLQRQYAASTSLMALERFESMLMKLKSDQSAIEKTMDEVSKIEENAKAQQDLLTGRLQIVEQLKHILEQQIGSPDVQDIIHRFSEASQSVLGESRLKRQINQLENELQMSKQRIVSQEAIINAMESEMIFVQKIWGKSVKSDEESVRTNSNVAVINVETVSVAVQVRTENRSVETQIEIDSNLSSHENDPMPSAGSDKQNVDNDQVQDGCDHQITLNDRLNQALRLASERSFALTKCESQNAEFQAKIISLNKLIDEKNSQLFKKQSNPDRVTFESNSVDTETSDKIVLKSTINSLQKIVNQKEETILRYQNLLKEDRDEHSKSAARLQEEIKTLQTRMAGMQQQVNQKINDYIHPPNSVPVKEKAFNVQNKNVDLEERAEKLNERVSTLEADLNTAKELSERWHRLAEERLKHMDHMRGRLEEQHKIELESYRLERDKWQHEADTLRQELSDKRMQLAKGNGMLAKELQEKENRIHELDIAYQQLQDEMEMAEKNTVTQQIVAHDSKMQEITNSIGRVQSNQLQAQLDLARRQQQALVEKERNYKSQIVDLKQQLSRRYMAAKTHEQKTSQREMQLERKTRSLEEELHNVKLQLEKEKFTHENKKLKTAEELALWDKQKRWQQTADKFKEKLKEKTEEFDKLQANYERLRTLVSCMEREKWYLRSKLRCENGCIVGSLSARPGNLSHPDVLEDLQHECHTLRNRVRELEDRLENADTSELMIKLEAQRRHISALENVTKGNEYVVDQLERLEATKDVLEKNNLKLESENLELRLEIEKFILDTPRLREKVEHLEKYIELLKSEKTSESSPRSSECKEFQDPEKKSVAELEKTVFTLKRVIEKLQAENKRFKMGAKKNPNFPKMSRPDSAGSSTSHLQSQYERAQQRIVALETDLQLSEQRIAMLENSRKEEDNAGEIGILRHQLAHKSELLDKVKQLLTRAAINEKSLRQRVQMLEAKQSLETIPECFVSPPTPDN
ncbi:centrosomal protein of 290 kDa isoform X2 [Athalia rosae]|uniref:centrosomal protein of 290 kDa isoform X2 n=1 Tax=Athalia rosae TaxID=37344 RepID=UPI00203395B1|nr:centrosomal protein of 290 kDa isoform X2 [Athalia rosae]